MKANPTPGFSQDVNVVRWQGVATFSSEHAWDDALS